MGSTFEFLIFRPKSPATMNIHDLQLFLLTYACCTSKCMYCHAHLLQPNSNRVENGLALLLILHQTTGLVIHPSVCLASQPLEKVSLSTLPITSHTSILRLDKGINPNPFSHKKYGQGHPIGTTLGF